MMGELTPEIVAVISRYYDDWQYRATEGMDRQQAIRYLYRQAVQGRRGHASPGGVWYDSACGGHFRLWLAGRRPPDPPDFACTLWGLAMFALDHHRGTLVFQPKLM